MPLLVKFLFPFLLANLLNSIYSTVDTIVIGHFAGSEGIVAVTMGSKNLGLFTNMGIAFAGGGQVYLSQLIGAKQKQEINGVIGTLFSEMLVLSVLFALLSVFLANAVLTWLNTPEVSFADARMYLYITSAGLPLMYGYNAISSVLRGMGNSKAPLAFIAIASLVNLVGDFVFIVFMHMGVAGAAIATVIGQGVSLVLSLIILYRHRVEFGFDFHLKSFAIIPEKLAIMFKLGFPVALRGTFISVAQLFMFSFINLYGITESTVYSIAEKLTHMTNIASMSAKQASGAMTGQNIGANRYDRVKALFRSTALIAIGSAVIISAASLLFPESIFRIFSDDPEVLSYAKVFMQIACLVFLLSAWIAPYDAIIMGTGNSMLSFLGGVLDGIVFRICFSFLFAYAFNMGITGFMLGEALARLGPLSVGMIYYYTGAWKKKKIL